MNDQPKDKYTRDVLFRLTRESNMNSWMAWMSANQGTTWEKLRKTETTFESAQMAIYDMMIDWAFPRIAR